VTILDCTAHWETVDGKQVYKAGIFTGGSASGFMHNSATSTTGALNIYDGIFTGNSRASSGGVICVQGKGTLNIYGGLFEKNSCTNSSGGVIYLGSSSNTTHIEGAVFKGNTAKTSGGVMYNYGKPSVTIKDTVMTENSAPSAGVIVSLGAITYENVTITGNTTTSGAYGALHHYNGTTATVILKGKTVIDDNYYGDPADGVERNVWLREHWYYVKNDGLTEGAKVGISMDPKRLALTDTRINIISSTVEESVKDFFSSDDPAYIVDVVEGKLKLVD
jgi:predicted outer membrane repeat protein